MNDRLARQLAAFTAHPYPDAKTRRARLRNLRIAIEDRADRILVALEQDLGKSPTEAYTSEVGFVLRDIRHAERRVGHWMRKRRVRTPWMTWPARAWFRPEPVGVVLILGPWNYPFQLLLSPLVGALAAGNGACLKPSEFAPHTATAVAEVCRAAFPEDLVTVVPGDETVAAQLTAQPFAHIFFTGSAGPGRKVAEAAAARLTPVTLELGGKSPCVVCADAPLEVTARRILWGKCLNAGQTCVAPDYVLVQEAVYEAFLCQCRRAAQTMIPTLDSPDLARIVNRRHFDRLCDLLADGRIVHGGETDASRLKIGPTLLVDVADDHPIMQEEIFGPLLPILPYREFEQAIDRILSRPSPLAAYLFTRSRRHRRRFADALPCGGVCVNDVVSHILPADLPFGGVGASGYGRTRGRAGFDAFSRIKSVMQRGLAPDLPLRYPPYRTPLRTIRTAYSWIAH